MFADIAFPTAVRQLFTYQVPEELISSSLLGKRVWVPYRNSYSIGVVVHVHSKTPEFNVKKIRKVLDDDPIIQPELLTLTNWIHKFYYCSWGEVLQAALPAGLNFISDTFIRVGNVDSVNLSKEEKAVFNDVVEGKTNRHSEAQKRWRNTKSLKIYNRLIKNGILELWDEPILKSKGKSEKWVEWGANASKKEALELLNSIERKSKWQLALSEICALEIPLKLAEVRSNDWYTEYSFKKLRNEGWLKVTEKEITTKFDHLTYEPEKIKELNHEQLIAFNELQKSIQKNKFASYLLKGITGSGKTEVYIHALKSCIEQGLTGIVLVPEIALTPQTVSRFYQVFGDKIAVLHSRMSNNERLSEWNSINEGKKTIVIGPRSAVFAPMQNLGIIILDEEHDASYKQIDPAPRYHAREVAIMRASAANAVVLMGSATPSMQALHMVAQKKCQLLTLSKRHALATLPDVQIIDLTEYKGAMKGSLSIALYNSVKQSLEKKEQAILLFNRRGFASYLQCETCGHIPKSPESSVSLTYHKRSNLLKCHYSGYSRKKDERCEVCGSDQLLIQGSGTQRIEEEIVELFPDAKILRFDKDSTSKKGAHEKILSQFGKKEADILVGTQLVSKGLDFPNVTTVGVIDADTEQAFPSFNSSERLFQLLSQVAGRSGRGSKEGKVFIQTRQADNSAIQFAKKHDFDGFSKEELGFREDLGYPPFSRLIQFTIKGKQEFKVVQSAQLLEEIIHQILPSYQVLGPSASVISWLNGNYFWELYLKIEPTKGEQFIEKVLDTIMQLYNSKSRVGSSVRININVDAQR